MKVQFALCLVLFGIVLLSTALHAIIPSLLFLSASIVCVVNHLALAHGAILKFQFTKVSGNTLPHGFAANVALSYLGLVIVLVSSFVLGLGGGGTGISHQDPGNGCGAEEFALLGSGGGAIEGEVVSGGDGTGAGFEESGFGEGEGTSSGKGEEALGSSEEVEVDEPEEADVSEPAMEQLDPEPAPVEDEPVVVEELVVEDEVIITKRKERHTLAFDPNKQVPVSIPPRSSRSPVRGGSSYYGSIASVNGSGRVVKPDKDTSILVFFDSSGSMNSTFHPLQVMRDTILRDALLPCYGTVELYEKKVRVISRPDERGIAWLGEGFKDDKSIVFIFQDESEGTYYNSAERYQPIFMPDLYNLRKTIEEFDGSYYRGIVFQVRNKDEGKRFQRFVAKTFQRPILNRSTFGKLSRYVESYHASRRRSGNPFTGTELVPFDPASVPPATPAHLADYLRRSGTVSFDVKNDVPEGSPPEYYLKRITMAAKRLGIDLAGRKRG
jgi:hypothetical protein